MAVATDNIGNTKRVITQRDFIRNICEFYSGATLTDTEVDTAAPKLIGSTENLFTWPDGSSYEPLKCLPGPFKTNATGTTTTFWRGVFKAIHNASYFFYCPPYTSSKYPFDASAVGDNVLISEDSCDTCYDTTIRMRGDEFKLSIKDIILDTGIDISEYNTPKIYVSAGTFSDETAGELIFGTGPSTNNAKSWTTGNTFSLYFSNRLLFADKTATADVQLNILISGDVQPIASSGVPLTLKSVPQFTDQNNKNMGNSSASLNTSGDSKYYQRTIKYTSPIAWSNFPTKLDITTYLTWMGSRGNVYLYNLNNTYPQNYLDEYKFTTGDTNSSEISVNINDTPQYVKPKWTLGFDSTLNYGGTGLGLNISPYYPYTKNINNNAFHILKYQTTIDSQNVMGAVPRYVVQVPNGLWVMPLTAAITTTSTSYSTGNTLANLTNCYAKTANIYIARQLQTVGASIYISGSDAAIHGTNDYLVPPFFKFKPTASGPKYVTGYIIYTKPDGTTATTRTMSKRSVSTTSWVTYGLTLNAGESCGGDILQLVFTTS